MKKVFTLKKRTADCVGLGVGVIIGMSIFNLLKNGDIFQDARIMFFILMGCSLICIFIIRCLNRKID